jgi:hypothetical protein
MHLRIEREITINASVDEVWRVLAHDFGHIDQWASVIAASSAAADVPAPSGAGIGGRVCTSSVAGFGEVQEEFTYYDEQAKRFGYRATRGMPGFVKSAENNWSVRPLETGKSAVEARGEIELGLIPGLFLAPILKLQFGRMSHQVAEELKYFVEHGRPHPRKLKAQQIQPGRASAVS